MNKILLTITIIMVLCFNAFAQHLEIEWANCYGGGGEERLYSIKSTTDNNYILCGKVGSGDGDVQNYFGFFDFWVIKINSNGDTIWTNNYGGTARDHASSIYPTYDNGYIITGITESTDNYSYTQNGVRNFLVIKVDSEGDTVWSKCYGGTLWDEANDVIQASDSSYFVCGLAFSTDVFVHNHFDPNYFDFFVVKINENGDTLWTKCYGGNHDDYANKIIQSGDDNFIVTGTTQSIDGNINQSFGNKDFLAIEINSEGDVLRSNSYGGSGDDEALDIIKDEDNGFILIGNTNSTDGDAVNNNGQYDVLIIKTDSVGNKLWSNCYGGSLNDNAYSIAKDSTGYVIAGCSESSNGDLNINNGDKDLWIFKIDSDGNLLWSETYGGTYPDIAYSLCIKDNEYVVGGTTASNDYDVSGNHGNYDWWVIKLNDLSKIESVRINKKFNVYPNPASDYITIPIVDILNVSISNVGNGIVKQYSLFNNESAIYVGGLPNGVYILQVSTISNIYIAKCIIAKE